VTDPYGEAFSAYESSPRSRGVALALACALGVFGAHRFYAGRTASGIAMLCTLGGLGLWALYDVILIAGGDFIDEEGRRISRWDPTEVDALPAGSSAELARMRQELDEMHERLEFAERLLSRPSDRQEER
jgi:hypothetical protein